MSQRKRNRFASAAAAVSSEPPKPEVTQPDPVPPPVAPVADEVSVTQRDPRPPEKKQTLAARVADAAAAQLLIFDQLPEDERPRPGDRVLLVGIVWGGSTLVELEQVATGGDLPVGGLFDLPSTKLSKNFPIVKHDGQDHVLSLPDEIHAEIHRGAGVRALGQVGRRIEAPFKGAAHKIGQDDRIVAQ